MSNSVSADAIRRYAAKILIHAAKTDAIKSMEEYAAGVEAGLQAGLEVIQKDPGAKQGVIEGTIRNAVSPFLQQCMARINAEDKARRAAEQDAALKEQADRAAEAEAARPDAEFASLLPGMPDAVYALEQEGFTTVNGLLDHAERQGLVYLPTLGLSLTESRLLIEALFTAGFNVARLQIANPPAGSATPEEVADFMDQQPELPAETEPEKEPEAETPEPAPTPPEATSEPFRNEPEPEKKPEKEPEPEAAPSLKAENNDAPLEQDALTGLSIRAQQALHKNGITTRTGLINYLTEHEDLSKLKSTAAVVLVLALRGSVLTDGTYWLNLPAGEFPCLSMVEHTNYQDKAH